MDAIRNDILAAAKSLEHAWRRTNLLASVVGSADLKDLHPDEFLSEIMTDISVAAGKIQKASRRLLCQRCPP